MEPDILRQFEALNAAYFANAGAREGGSESESESERRSESGSEADDIEHAIEDALLPLDADDAHVGGRAWRLQTDSTVGRHLVAARDIPAGALVFRESPLVVAHAGPGDDMLVAVAMALVQSTSHATARLLQEPVLSDSDTESFQTWAHKMYARHVLDNEGIGCTVEDFTWAIGVASVNVHAGRKPSRGVLGLLSSMMAHSCEPAARVDISADAQGSVLTLRTVRHVAQGESLTICYVQYHLPRAERQRQLHFQHGFVCECERCRTNAPANSMQMVSAQVLASGDGELARWVRQNTRDRE